MALYALVDLQDMVRRYEEFAAAPAPLPPAKGLRWLPVETTDPPFNPATQKRTGPSVMVLPGKVTRVWTVTAKSAAEIDQDKADEAVAAIDPKIMRALISWLAPLVGKTPQQSRDEIVATYKQL